MEKLDIRQNWACKIYIYIQNVGEGGQLQTQVRRSLNGFWFTD